MFRLALIVVLGLAGALPAAAQQIPPPGPPHAPQIPRPRPPHAWHALNPSLSLGVRAVTPLEQQMQQNYRTELLQAQRELLQANPSGLGRTQIAIGRELNNYDTAPR